MKAAEAKTLQSKLGWAREMRDQEYAAERQAERAREVEAEHARLRRLAAALSEVDFQVGQRERAPPECGIDAYSGLDSGFGGLGRAQRAAWLHWEQVLQEEEASGWYAEVYAFCHNVPWASGTSCEASDDPWDAAAADFRRACRVLEPLDYAEPRYFCSQDGGRSAYEQREAVLFDLAAEATLQTVKVRTVYCATVGAEPTHCYSKYGPKPILFATVTLSRIKQPTLNLKRSASVDNARRFSTFSLHNWL